MNTIPKGRSWRRGWGCEKRGGQQRKTGTGLAKTAFERGKRKTNRRGQFKRFHALPQRGSEPEGREEKAKKARNLERTLRSVREDERNDGKDISRNCREAFLVMRIARRKKEKSRGRFR